MEKILDFSVPLDIELFDRVAQEANNASGASQAQALQTLAEFQAHPESWQRSDALLKANVSDHSKFIALRCLDQAIHRVWNALPSEQRVGVRNFIVNQVMEISQSAEQLVSRRVLAEKLNQTLVEIVKKEWPDRWPNFVSELVGSAAVSESLMQNNLAILRQLSEEIFQFSKGKMTQQQVALRRAELTKEADKVFSLIHHALANKQQPPLLLEALNCTQACLAWIPPKYFFGSDILTLLVQKFLMVPVTRVAACKCLVEVAAFPAARDDPNAPVLPVFGEFISALSQVIPVPPGMSHAQAVSAFCGQTADRGDQFVQVAALFLITFLKTHMTSIIEPTAMSNAQVLQALHEAHRYLLGMSYLEDSEIFKMCVEYWTWLASMKAHEMLLVAATGRAAAPKLHDAVFTQVRKLFVTRMARPEEVIVFEDEHGEIVREKMKEVDTIAHHRLMQKGLVCLTHLSWEETYNIMFGELQRITQNFQPGPLAVLTWAIGSISGAMTEENEKQFLIQVLGTLLSLATASNDTPRPVRACLASGVMYIVGQYPRFLVNHFPLLVTVLKKLFEFMGETFEGVQDMACDTYLKIAHSCAGPLVQAGEDQPPYIYQLLRDMPMHTAKLSKKQKYVAYEATGLVIARAEGSMQQELIQMYMSSANEMWQNVMQHAAANEAVVTELPAIEALADYFKTCVCGVVSLGEAFQQQIFALFNQTMRLYAIYSTYISGEVERRGAVAAHEPIVRQMRIVKKDILNLLEEFCKRSSDTQYLSQTILPPLLDTVLTDYNKSVSKARDPLVISLMTVLVEKLGVQIEPHVPGILDSIMGVTLEMIAKDHEYPDHRDRFYKLLRALNTHCFDSFLRALQSQPVIMDAIVAAMQDSKSSIEEVGLELLLSFLESVSRCELAPAFFQIYFLNLLHAVFNVLLDPCHKTGFKLQCAILRHLVQTCKLLAKQGGSISCDQGEGVSATQFLQRYLGEQLSQFQNLKPQQVHRFVEGLFKTEADDRGFRLLVRDFLVELHEYAADEDLSRQRYDGQQPDAVAAHTEELARLGVAVQPKADQLRQACFDGTQW